MMHSRFLPAIATAFFAIMLSGFSAALCADCNLVSVSLASDANEYTIAAGQNITLTLGVKKIAAPTTGPSEVGYKLTMQRPGFGTPSDVLTGETALLAFSQQQTILLTDLQPGLYQFNLAVTYIKDGGPGITNFSDNVTSDNYASVYVTVRKPSLQVPETTPLLAFAAAAGALLILSGSGRRGSRTR